MKAIDLLKNKDTHVWTIKENATIHDALGLLYNKGIGALIVTDDKEQVVGILSERDITRACYKNINEVDSTPVHKIMTKDLIVGTPNDEVDYMMGIMTNNKIRHLPIIEDKKLRGIISIGDVTKVQLHSCKYENHYLKDYMFGPQSE